MTLLDLLKLCRKHLLLLILMPIAFAVATAGYAFVVMDDTFTAESSLYVLVSQSTTDTSTSSSSSLQSDLNSSEMITADVAELIQSNSVMTAAADDLGLTDLSDYSISVETSDDSRMIYLSVEGENQTAVADVANALANNASAMATEVMNVEAVNIIDEAETPEEASGPNRLLYIAAAFCAGIFVALAIIVITDMLNVKIRDEEELEELSGIPIMAHVPYVKDGVDDRA